MRKALNGAVKIESLLLAWKRSNLEKVQRGRSILLVLGA